MNSEAWRRIKDNLEQMSMRHHVVRGKDDFWSDFRAHARLRRREEYVPARHVPVWGWAVSAVCAVLAIAGMVAYPLVYAGREHGNTINFLDVTAEHSGVFIDNSPEEGTFIWVMDMETESGAPGSS